jgi:hypothetical protein
MLTAVPGCGRLQPARQGRRSRPSCRSTLSCRSRSARCLRRPCRRRSGGVVGEERLLPLRRCGGYASKSSRKASRSVTSDEEGLVWTVAHSSSQSRIRLTLASGWWICCIAPPVARSPRSIAANPTCWTSSNERTRPWMPSILWSPRPVMTIPRPQRACRGTGSHSTRARGPARRRGVRLRTKGCSRCRPPGCRRHARTHRRPQGAPSFNDATRTKGGAPIEVIVPRRTA